MNRRGFHQLLVSLGMMGVGACSGVQQVKAASDFEGATWKQFEVKAAGKTIRFDFPVNVPGTTTFEFNSSFTNNDDHRIVALRTDEKIGWVHASSGVNIFISVARYRGTNSDGSWTPYFQFTPTRSAFDAIITQERKQTDPSRSYSFVRLGNLEWLRTISFRSSGSHDGDKYRAVFNNDYLISISFNLGTRGKPDEARLAELRRVGEHIVSSVRIE